MGCEGGRGDFSSRVKNRGSSFSMGRYFSLSVKIAATAGLLAALNLPGAVAADDAAPAVTNIPASTISVDNLKRVPKDVVTELILDASGSMKQKLGQRTKLYQAKRVMRAFMTQAQNDNMVLGLRVYGLQEKNCKDSKLVYGFGEKGADAVDAAMEEINPKGYGKTPLEFSLRAAADDLKKHPDKPKRIILVTDGMDTCGGNPCKIAKELKQKYDIRIYVVGYALDPGEREQLKCLGGDGGGMWDANDIQGLLDALKDLSDQSKNLIVKSPDPLGTSVLYEVEPGKSPRKAGQFISSLGTHVDPGKHYEVRVLLEPEFVFRDVVVKPKEVKVLVVQGKGLVNIQFHDQLFAVTVLDEHGTPVMSFPSDVPTPVPAGFYKVRAVSPPFAEATIDDIKVVPGGKYEEKIKGFGVLQVDSDKAHGPGPFGYYVFDDQKKMDLGSYLTGVPLVLPESRYIIKTVGNALLKNVYPDVSGIRHLPIPPPGQTVTFERREKPDKDEPKGPKMLDELSPGQVEQHLKGMENQGK
jgi:Mg-chelatase subunit ChlD